MCIVRYSGLELSPRSDWEGVVHDADVVTGMAEDADSALATCTALVQVQVLVKKKGKGRKYSTLGK